MFELKFVLSPLVCITYIPSTHKFTYIYAEQQNARNYYINALLSHEFFQPIYHHIILSFLLIQTYTLIWLTVTYFESCRLCTTDVVN